MDEVTPEQAKEMVRQERERRGQVCSDEINKVLEEYRCRLEWLEVRRGGKLVEAHWQIVPLE